MNKSIEYEAHSQHHIIQSTLFDALTPVFFSFLLFFFVSCGTVKYAPLCVLYYSYDTSISSFCWPRVILDLLKYQNKVCIWVTAKFFVSFRVICWVWERRTTLPFQYGFPFWFCKPRWWSVCISHRHVELVYWRRLMKIFVWIVVCFYISISETWTC